jgi:hypothetical protein
MKKLAPIMLFKSVLPRMFLFQQNIKFVVSSNTTRHPPNTHWLDFNCNFSIFFHYFFPYTHFLALFSVFTTNVLGCEMRAEVTGGYAFCLLGLTSQQTNGRCYMLTCCVSVLLLVFKLSAQQPSLGLATSCDALSRYDITPPPLLLLREGHAHLSHAS